MLEYFQRQILLWGEQRQLNLSKKRVLIVGAGGLGSSLCYALGSSGIGEIHIVDFDEVSISNIHRQIAFDLSDEHKSKAKINAQKIESRCRFTKAFAYDIDFSEFSEKEISFDLIIDATDNLEVRALIDAYATQKQTPWIYGSVEAYHGRVAFFDKTSYSELFKQNSHTPNGVTAPMVMHIASLQANLALRYLAGLSVKKDMLYYLYFNDDGELITQKFNLRSE